MCVYIYIHICRERKRERENSKMYTRARYRNVSQMYQKIKKCITKIPVNPLAFLRKLDLSNSVCFVRPSEKQLSGAPQTLSIIWSARGRTVRHMDGLIIIWKCERREMGGKKRCYRMNGQREATVVTGFSPWCWNLSRTAFHCSFSLCAFLLFYGFYKSHYSF